MSIKRQAANTGHLDVREPTRTVETEVEYRQDSDVPNTYIW